MTIQVPTANKGERVLDLAILWLQRAAGLTLFGFGILYWTRLVGVYPVAGWRFDLMSLEWRVAAPLLAVLCPVAGVGLWLAVSWGTVLWLLVAATEGAMRFVLPDRFGGPDLELVLHLSGLGLLGVLRIVHWELRRRARHRLRKHR